jgi:hypothetical protein
MRLATSPTSVSRLKKMWDPRCLDNSVGHHGLLQGYFTFFYTISKGRGGGGWESLTY